MKSESITQAIEAQLSTLGHRMGLVLSVSLVAAGALAWRAAAQEGAGEMKKADVASGFTAAQAKLGELQKSIGAAIEKLKGPVAADAERVKLFDEIIARLKDAEASINDSSVLGMFVEQSIKNSRGKQAEYEKRAIDVNLQPEARANCDKLIEQFKNNAAEWNYRKLVINNMLIKFQRNIKTISDLKRFFADASLSCNMFSAEITGKILHEAIVLNTEFGKMIRTLSEPAPVRPRQSSHNQCER